MSITLQFIGALLGLGLPWLLGVLLIVRLIPEPVDGRNTLLLGYGYFIGLLVITLGMRALEVLELGLMPLNLWLLALLPTAVLMLWAKRTGQFNAWRLKPPRLTLETLIIAGLLAFLGWRGLGLTLEIIERPLFPWDATMHWATKARVWSEWQQLLPFVSAEHWLSAQDPWLFTDHHPHYPRTIPLLQTWMNAMLGGGWHDRLMNLPWAGAYIALGLALFGQLRLAGINAVVAMLGVYLLLSLPLLNTHIALAGYADVFLGAFYLLAIMAFYQWARCRTLDQAVLALITGIACLMIKNEGLMWLLTLLIGLMALYLRPHRLVLVLAIGLIAGLSALWLLPADWVIAGHQLGALGLGFYPAAILPLLSSLFALGSWHLLYWLVVLAVSATLVQCLWSNKHCPERPLQAVGLALGVAYGLLLLLFTTTRYADSLPGLTSVSRITLHLAPATVFVLMLLYHHLVRISTPAASLDSTP